MHRSTRQGNTPDRPLILLVSMVLMLLPILGAAAEKLDDAAISLAVTQRLYNDPGVSNMLLAVDVNSGVVTLGGSVTTLLAKDRSERLAETVKGVRAIVNRIEVIPTFKPDDKLEAQVEAALVDDPAADAKEIRVAVDKQKVILSGAVDSWPEKQLAERLARAVSGVREVDNRIEVRLDPQRSDKELEREIEEIIAWDALIDDDQIDVAVEDRGVSLTGYVASLAEKRRAANQSWIPGVHGVDHSDLEVATWNRDPRFRKKKYAKLDKPDPAIAAAVRAALKQDPRVPADGIRITVRNDAATLTGEVDNLLSKRAAERTTHNTLGVYRVVNHIQVRSGTPSDEVLEDRMTAAIARHPDLENRDIGIAVVDGVVDLKSTVDSYYEKALADNTAAGVYGVVHVDNDLFVEHKPGDRLPYSPYVDEAWYNRDFDWYTRSNGYADSGKSDWEIFEDVKDELYWSPFVDSEQVAIVVDDGVVTLTGVVDSWSERQTATERAYEGGAIYVDNDLRVRHGPDYYAPES